MSARVAGDRGLRELERAAHAGEQGAAVRLLLERHRIGQLPEAQLRLAAHLQDPVAVAAARELLGVAPRRHSLGKWIRAIGRPRLKDWGRELPWTQLVQPVCTRAAVVAVELALPCWSSPEAFAAGEVDAEDLSTVRTILRLAQAWLRSPSRAFEDAVVSECSGRALSGLAGSVGLELASVVCQPAPASPRSPYSAQQHSASSAAQVIEYAAGTLRDAGTSEATLRDAIREATVPWLLGAPAP